MLLIRSRIFGFIILEAFVVFYETSVILIFPIENFGFDGVFEKTYQIFFTDGH